MYTSQEFQQLFIMCSVVAVVVIVLYLLIKWRQNENKRTDKIHKRFMADYRERVANDSTTKRFY